MDNADKKSNVIEVVKDAPNDGLIKHIEEILRQAKSGELQGVIIISSFDDNTVNSSWHADIMRNRMRLIGELEQVKYHFLAIEKLD